jgi:hypothetical protein
VLTGAARLEDTFNLLGHAARKLLECAAAIADREPAELATAIGAPALAASSTKRGLDIDWNDPEQKAEAIKKLVAQIDRLEQWVRNKLGDQAERPPLSGALATLAQLRDQDLEPDLSLDHEPHRSGAVFEHEVVAADPATSSSRHHDLRPGAATAVRDMRDRWQAARDERLPQARLAIEQPGEDIGERVLLPSGLRGCEPEQRPNEVATHVEPDVKKLRSRDRPIRRERTAKRAEGSR